MRHLNSDISAFLVFCILGLTITVDTANARSKSRSTAHKQIDYTDPHPGEYWLTQLNTEVDRYTNADYLYTSLTTSKNNWSFQIGGQNIPLTADTGTQTYLYTGIAKQIDITPWLNITAGSHAGSYTNQFSFLNFDYLNLGITKNNLNVAVGPYYANKELTETFSKIGYTVTWNYFLYKFVLNGSYISGKNNLSGLTTNLGYNINRHIQPYLGFGDVAPNLSCDKCNPYYYMAIGVNLNY